MLCRISAGLVRIKYVYKYDVCNINYAIMIIIVINIENYKFSYICFYLRPSSHNDKTHTNDPYLTYLKYH